MFVEKTKVGLNGFGRIGKCLFIQLINHSHLEVCAINAPSLDMNYLIEYLKFDSIHKYDTSFEVEVIDDSTFRLNGKSIKILRERDAKLLNWKEYGINYVIDSTGVYLTEKKAKDHAVDLVVMCAPPKDETPMFVYSVNHTNYEGQSIISNASCTTNCITPVLKSLENNFSIESSNFTTIHACTASQGSTDTLHSKARTCRSLFNNIIPHTTGASSSVYAVIPSMKNKITGTSLRVPVNNVSIVDLNVKLSKKTDLKEVLKTLKETHNIKVTDGGHVSSDFMTTTCPSIVDKKACLDLGNNEFKIMIWYDNEWSYSAQTIELTNHCVMYLNESKKESGNETREEKFASFCIDNVNFYNENVVVRVDYNCPIDSNGNLSDNYRITSSAETLKKIFNDNPNYIVLMSHFGRPKGKDEKNSLRRMIPEIEKLLGTPVHFLEDGLDMKSVEKIRELDSQQGPSDIPLVFLMENLRFHPEETKYKNLSEDSPIMQVVKNLGTCYVNDAFGCMHRDHLSICGFPYEKRCYGYLVEKEIKALQMITCAKSEQKILGIIGGGKMDDKLPLLENLSKKLDNIYIAGGNINSIVKEKKYSTFIESIKNNKALITLMIDGLAEESHKLDYDSQDSEANSMYINLNQNDLGCTQSIFDIGFMGLRELFDLIIDSDIVFWNGTLGLVENKTYEWGSHQLVKYLMNCGKKVIIGGGDTAGYCNKFNHNFTHVSTGGGASIEYLCDDWLVGMNVFQ